MRIKQVCILIYLFSINLIAQNNDQYLLSLEEFTNKLNYGDTELEKILTSKNELSSNELTSMLSFYFRTKMSARYFFNWQNFRERYQDYTTKYPKKIGEHEQRSIEMIELYKSDNDWNLPMRAVDGSELTAYQFRHLARQHKSVDICFDFYQQNETKEYIEYISEFLKSLLITYMNNSYEKSGNGVFESYRAGYRIFNWLFVYNLLLASEKFDEELQLLFIKTFYYHAEELRKSTSKFHYGNHQTKGLVALALIAILFPEFDKSEEWREHSFKLLSEHLNKEVNEDGFQFERSVHYHIGDIDNYFYVYYLAKLNNISVPKEFESQLNKMFSSLIKIAYPNKTLPVLQDDTDSPWAEYNKMGSVMALGAILFKDSSLKYFSSSEIRPNKFWFIRPEDQSMLNKIKPTRPTFINSSLNITGYFCMREGFNKEDISMIISAGLSEFKPDHQHGDMLGIQLYAFQNYMLPNYQCRYYLEDYSYFKNSFVKNVALIDSIPQGGKWKGNKGGSGFGKWKSLPNPTVLSWVDDDDFSLFIGSHDQYDKLNIKYTRTVVYIRDGYFLVKDEFQNLNGTTHDFQQVWQGHYSSESKKNRLIRSVFPNGSGLDIYQLTNENYLLSQNSIRGKGSSIISYNSDSSSAFVTLIRPFSDFENRLILNSDGRLQSFNQCEIFQNEYTEHEIRIIADHILRDKSTYTIFGFSLINIGDLSIQSDESRDLLLKVNGKIIEMFSIDGSQINLTISGYDNYYTEKIVNSSIVNLASGNSIRFLEK